ncbi:hypothetical protein [Paludibacterium yongneupense]|nr:hypothetical protein [Paludibacterium yongneupense]
MRRILATLVMCSLLATLSACIILPFGDHDHGGFDRGGPHWHDR